MVSEVGGAVFAPDENRARENAIGWKAAGAGASHTWPISMEAVFFRLLAGVKTTLTLLSLFPLMELALTS